MYVKVDHIKCKYGFKTLTYSNEIQFGGTWKLFNLEYKLKVSPVNISSLATRIMKERKLKK